MKKLMFIAASVVVCLFIFFVMPYMMLKSSLQPDCVNSSIQCENTSSTQLQQFVQSIK